ncbi:MAG: hypothetical protein VYE04_01750 [Pseudomonadota bacterium]|nr:hypothetical protein [Pseudomonadota bacterium]
MSYTIGTVAVMSSALGSVASNIDGTWEAYRASKARLIARYVFDPLMECPII